MGIDRFQPSEAKVRFFLGVDGDIWTEAGGAARYGPEAGFSNLGPALAMARVSVAGNIANFGSEPETLPAEIGAGVVPLQHPLRSSLWEAMLLSSLLGAHDTPTQLDASTAFLTLFDNKQVDVSYLDRALWMYFDKTGAKIERWGPANVQSWALTVANSSVVASLWNLISLQTSFHEGILDIDTGAPTVVPIYRGFLDAAGDALVRAEQQLNLKVVGAPTGAGTIADPKVITFAADLGSSPVFGSVTFTVKAGVNLEGNPRWSRVVDSVTGDELGDGINGVPLEIAIIDVSGAGYADLDVVSTPLIAQWTPVLTTEPTLVSVNTCVSVDGEIVANPETFTSTITSDLIRTIGGFCIAQSNNFAHEGNLTGEIGLVNRWTTDIRQNQIRHGAKVGMVVTIDSRVVIDPGTSNETFKTIIRMPNLRSSDGSTLKAFPGGATDSSETLAYRAHPDASIGDTSIRVEQTNTVSNVEV